MLLDLERGLRAASPLEKRGVTRALTLELTGTMQPYSWTLNGKRFEDRDPLMVRAWQRVEIISRNKTMISHPKHLHGHHFQVVAVGGNSRQDIYIHTAEWRGVEELFSGSADAAEERSRIAEAVAFMERIVGSMSPTGRDLGGNEYPVENAAGQMDCIDETTNTTSYLKLFEARGLLKWHRIIDRVYRAPQILDQHWAAGIEEVSTGEQFAVDSWFKDNGQTPYIQPVEAWKQKIALDR